MDMPDWVTRFPGSVTVSDDTGTVLYMNEAAIARYGPLGGAANIGTNMLGCHPDGARAKVEEMLATPSLNVYTIEKGGRRSLIYHTTWYSDGQPMGLVELILDLPAAMPHHVRDG